MLRSAGTAALLLSLAALAGPTTSVVQAASAGPAGVAPAPTRLSELPASLHRRALEVIEDQRDRSDSRWTRARLRDRVVAMYRPGEADPAYVEFSLEDPDGAPQGFMVLSTGAHDHPVVHLVHEGLAPSARLQRAAGDDETATRFFRLGYSAYVAEDDTGNLVAREGVLPGKVSGYDAAWIDLPEQARAGSFRWDPDTGVQERRASVGEGVRFTSWPSWTALKAEYADNYAGLHAAARKNAAGDWAAERAIADNGGTLQNGEFRELPLLGGRGAATYTVRGGGRDAVRVELGERSLEGDMALRVFVDTAPTDEVAPVDIDVLYANGTSETLRLNVTERIPTDVLGALAPTATATGGTVSLRVRRLNVPGMACSKAILKTDPGSTIHLVGSGLRSDGVWRTDDAIMRIEVEGGSDVAFLASNNRYVRAVGAGGGAIAVDASAKGSHERFRIYDRGEGYGLLAADRRHTVRFALDGSVDAAGGSSRDSEFFVDYCQPRRIAERWAGDNVADVITNVRKYGQLEPHMAPSTSQCASGCGGTAWAMLFGFHDYEAENDAKWTPHAGLYKVDGGTTGASSGPGAVAPEWLWRETPGHLLHYNGAPPEPNAAAMVWELSQVMNDWTVAGCGPTGQKWTAPVEMGKAHIYLDRRSVNAPLVSDYDGAAIMTHEGKVKAYNVIGKKQPVVIGIGSLSHYPLAVGWDNSEYRVWDRGGKKWSSLAERAHFVVHMGWGGPHLETVPYDTWLQGSLNVPEAQTIVTTVKASAEIPKPVPKPLPKAKNSPNQQPLPKGPLPQKKF